MTDKRFRRKKYKELLITEDLYKKWKVTYPEYKEYTIVMFREYWKEIAKKYTEVVVTNPHGVRLPFYMGDISLKYVSKLEDNLNHHKTFEQGVAVNHMNFVTNGRSAKIIWSVDHARKFNKFLPIMGFEGSRVFKKLANNQLVENPEIFKNTASSKANRLFRIKKLKNND